MNPDEQENGLPSGKAAADVEAKSRFGTVALFRSVQPERWEHVASGVLLKFEDRYYLATATHAVRELGGYWVAGPGYAIKVNWRPFHCVNGIAFTPGRRNQEPIDFACVELTDNEVSILAREHRFFQLDRDVAPEPVANCTTYGLTGFPCQLHRNDATASAPDYPFTSLTVILQSDRQFLSHSMLRKADQEWYVSASVDHQSLTHDQRAFLKAIEYNFQGLSGGALWFLQATDDYPEGPFAGMALEAELKKNKRVFTGVGAWKIVNLLVQWRDELRFIREDPANRQPMKGSA